MEASVQGPPVRGAAAYLGELLGTFGLVFFICMAVSEYGVGGDFVAIAFVHVFALFMLIQTLAVVSGAHFNPAVTVAMVALRQIRPPDALIYIVVQLTGGILGALATRALLTDEGLAVNYGAPAITPLLDGVFAGFMVELAGTFFLMFAIVGVAVNPKGSQEWAAFTIGATLGLVVFVGAQLTGASYNPARALGPALVSGEVGPIGPFLLVYILAPVVGAVSAAAAYFRLFMTPGKKVGGAEPVG